MPQNFKDVVLESEKRRCLVQIINVALQKATETERPVKISFDGIKMDVLPITADEYARGLNAEDVRQRHKLNLIAYYTRKKNYKNLKAVARRESFEQHGADVNQWIDTEKFDAGARRVAYRDLKVSAMKNEYLGRVFIFAKRFAKMMQYFMKQNGTGLTPQIVEKSLEMTRPNEFSEDGVRWAVRGLVMVWAHGAELGRIRGYSEKSIRQLRVWAVMAPPQYEPYRVTGQSPKLRRKKDKQKQR